MTPGCLPACRSVAISDGLGAVKFCCQSLCGSLTFLFFLVISSFFSVLDSRAAARRRTVRRSSVVQNMRYMGYLVFERLGGARTTLVVYDTIHGTCQKQLPAEASNDGLTSVSAAHPGHGVSPRSLSPGAQIPALAAIIAPCRLCLDWYACRRSSRKSSGLCE